MNIVSKFFKNALFSSPPKSQQGQSDEMSTAEAPSDDDGPGAGGGYDTFDFQMIDSDGPGAGGGYDYDDADVVPNDSDGPGAGGGYDNADFVPNDSDGPGAGGGYDNADVVPNDSDGPGAGGGYDVRAEYNMADEAIIIGSNDSVDYSYVGSVDHSPITVTHSDDEDWLYNAANEPIFVDMSTPISETIEKDGQ